MERPISEMRRPSRASRSADHGSDMTDERGKWRTHPSSLAATSALARPQQQDAASTLREGVELLGKQCTRRVVLDPAPFVDQHQVQIGRRLRKAGVNGVAVDVNIHEAAVRSVRIAWLG